jgi:hypothetical protein
MGTAMSAGDKKDETTATKPAVPPESDREQKRNLAYLVVLAGVSAGEMFKLQKDRTVVGRGPTVGVRLNDEGVSREHCAFVRDGEKMIVEDTGSTNGTFCNGIKIDRRELVDGDKIMVGSSTILKFTYHDYLDEVFQRQMYESALRRCCAPRTCWRASAARSSPSCAGARICRARGSSPSACARRSRIASSASAARTSP